MGTARKIYFYLVHIFAVLGVIACGLAGRAAWMQAHMLYPSPERESAFYKGYNPAGALKPHQSPQYGWAISGPSNTGASGSRYVTNSKEFRSYFVIQSDRWPALITAMNEDVNAQILRAGARILTHTGGTGSRFRFTYVLGQTTGAVSISRVQASKQFPDRPLPVGLERTGIGVAIVERWYPHSNPPEVMTDESDQMLR